MALAIFDAITIHISRVLEALFDELEYRLARRALRREAKAEWKGNLAEGSGRLKVGSGAIDVPYSFKSRFEEGQSATNPEELIGRMILSHGY